MIDNVSPAADSSDKRDELIVSRSDRLHIEIAKEQNLWFIIAAVVALGIMFNIAPLKAHAFDDLTARYTELLAVVLVVLFPVIFRLTFGTMPLAFLRQLWLRKKQPESFADREILGRNRETGTEFHAAVIPASIHQSASVSAEALFARYAEQSQALSQSIYARSGVYLIVGVIVAFSGIVFFYSQTGHNELVFSDGISLLISLAPKFGILFFIEFVALFFLRQYRSAMDEFRYYEAIKRNREETLALIQLIAAKEDEINPLDLVKNDSFFSSAGRLNKGQTTELIETRRLEKNEIELLEKILDVVCVGKSK